MAATAAALAHPSACSDARLAANRANAQHSTGPVTPEGKAASSRNATKHGIFTCIDALPRHERAILDAFLAEFSPGPQASEEMTEICQRWAILRYRIDKCQRQEFACLAELVRAYCEAEGIELPEDPYELSSLESRVLLRDMSGPNVIMRLRSYELRLNRQLDKLIAEYKELKRFENTLASLASSALSQPDAGIDDLGLDGTLTGSKSYFASAAPAPVEYLRGLDPLPGILPPTPTAG